MAEAIKQGKVKVNDAVAESFNHPVDPEKDHVFFEGRAIDLKPDYAEAHCNLGVALKELGRLMAPSSPIERLSA